MVAHQAPLSMGFPRQEYWSGLPYCTAGDLPDPGIKLVFPALASGFFTPALPGKPCFFSSVQFSRSVMSYSLRPHEPQHARPPCPSPTPVVHQNPCPLNQWCHPTISSSVVPFSSCLSIFPSIRVFSSESILCIRWPKYCSFSFSISPSNEYSGLISFRMDWFDLLAVQWTLESLLQTTVQKHQFFGTQLSLWSNCLIHTWLLEKTTALTSQTFVSKVVSLLFQMLRNGFNDKSYWEKKVSIC